MQCRICQYELPQGVTLCPNCGTQDALPNQGIPPEYPTPPPAPYTPYPTTDYGASAPPPPASSYPAYGAPANPYEVPQNQYSAPATSYPMPQAGQYGAPPVYAQAPQQPKSNRGCVIAAVIVITLFVLIVGGIATAGYIAYNAAHNAVTSITSQFGTTTAQPTTGTTNTNVPDPSQIDSNAASMIISAQSSSGIDSNFLPTDSQSSFNVGDTVYVTFKTAGNTGYIMSKWFQNGQDVADSSPIADTSGQTAGYFNHAFSASGSAVVGLYWCTQADCSDAALAQVVNVNVS